MPLRLPDTDAFGRGYVKRVAGLDPEGGVPGVDVPDDTVHSILAVAVRIAGGEVADRLGSHLPGPRLRPAEETARVAGEAVADWCFRRGQRLMRGFVPERRPAEIGDILAHRQIGLDVHSG